MGRSFALIDILHIFDLLFTLNLYSFYRVSIFLPPRKEKKKSKPVKLAELKEGWVENLPLLF